MSLPERDLLEAALVAMLGRLRRFDELSSGTTGATFLVETEAGRFAAKVFGPDSLALLGPELQFGLLLRLADTRIAPRPRGFDRDQRLLVTEYLETAAPMAPGSLRQQDRIADLAAALRTLHGVTAEIPGFDPAADAGRYVAAAGGVDELSRRDRARFAELLDLAASLELAGSSLCHNDLVPSNLLFDSRCRLIDFDYAVLGAPVVDLASVAVMNDLSESETQVLLDAYGHESGRLSLVEFARVKRLVRLLAHFWSLASQSAGTDIVGQYRIGDD